jgi:hypothetical protein
MKNTLVLTLLLLVVGLPGIVHAQGAHAQATEQGRPEASFWMKQKLQLSQNILAGLTSGDFEMIKASAESLSVLNHVEGFVRRRNPGYQAQVTLFQFANDELIRAAHKQNLERATLAYTQMTISCVNCHKQLREAPAKQSE